MSGKRLRQEKDNVGKAKEAMKLQEADNDSASEDRIWLQIDKLKENINQVEAMKLSPFYKVFEEEAITWEDKFNRIIALFDVWIDE